jgi:hypothetical protein
MLRLRGNAVALLKQGTSGSIAFTGQSNMPVAAAHICGAMVCSYVRPLGPAALPFLDYSAPWYMSVVYLTPATPLGACSRLAPYKSASVNIRTPQSPHLHPVVLRRAFKLHGERCR